MPEKEVNKQELEERVLIISRKMLSGIPTKKICHLMSLEWGVSERQIKRYIAKSYTMWRREYGRRLRSGLNYHMAIRMGLYEEAYKGKTIKITKPIKGGVVTIEKTEDQDFHLCLEIAKDIARLEGLYIERKEEGPPGSFATWVKAMAEEKERRRKKNSKPNK